MGKKFPFKRIPKYTSKRTLLSTPKLEGVLEAIKIEISQIPITDNIPPNRVGQYYDIIVYHDIKVPR